MLDEARQETGLAIVTEVMDTRDVELVYRYADAFQIGARNSQNFNLLREVGKFDKPVFLKRGMSMTIKEWLMSAEYVIAQGNPHVVFVERGIRTFETATRNTLDISAVAVLQEEPTCRCSWTRATPRATSAMLSPLPAQASRVAVTG